MKPVFKNKEIVVIDDFVEATKGVKIPEKVVQVKEILFIGAEVTKYEVGQTIQFKRALAESQEISGKKYLIIPIQDYVTCSFE